MLDDELVWRAAPGPHAFTARFRSHSRGERLVHPNHNRGRMVVEPVTASAGAPARQSTGFLFVSRPWELASPTVNLRTRSIFRSNLSGRAMVAIPHGYIPAQTHTSTQTLGGPWAEGSITHLLICTYW